MCIYNVIRIRQLHELLWCTMICFNFCDHSSKVPSVSNQLAGHNEEVNQFTIPSQTGTIQVPHNEEPVPKNEEPVPNNDEPVTSVINEMYEDRVIPDGYAVVDTEDVSEL